MISGKFQIFLNFYPLWYYLYKKLKRKRGNHRKKIAVRKISFLSSNKKAGPVTFKEAFLRGQAPDYGLYMPSLIPRLPEEKIESFKNTGYCRIAFEVTYPFLAGEIGPEKLEQIIRESYDFNIPVQKAKKNLHIMWLTRGPTASFKDFAARFMSRLMAYFAQQENRKFTILVATSGDTGGAVADAFYGLENVNAVILFPEKEVTERQRKQMTTFGGNIVTLSVRGKFDDCQAIVKKAFNDSSLRSLNLTSANSINFGRLLPQSVYYFYGYSRVSAERVVFSVPCGNFGNLMGGTIARRMGLPVEKFIAGVNENDEFPRFLETGRYSPVVPSRQCSSNAMNVGHPSNLALLVDLYGGWLADERDGKGNVTRKGVLKIMPDMDKLRKDFVSYSISEKEVDETIIRFWEKHGILLEPHGAVAAAAAEKDGDRLPVISLETADPAKFPQKIKSLLGFEPQLPESLRGVEGKEEHCLPVANDYEIFKKCITGKLSRN